MLDFSISKKYNDKINFSVPFSLYKQDLRV